MEFKGAVHAVMGGSKLSKKDNPSPSQWTIIRCQKWLDLSLILDDSDIAILCAKIQVRLDAIVAKALSLSKRRMRSRSFVPAMLAIIGLVMIQFFV